MAAGITLCTAAFAGYNAYENQSSSAQSDLLIQNLEALTQQESGGGVCFNWVLDEGGPLALEIINCRTCSSTTATYVKDSGSC